MIVLRERERERERDNRKAVLSLRGATAVRSRQIEIHVVVHFEEFSFSPTL